MRKVAFLAAVGLVALSSSWARAADAGYQPCCQDTAKMFGLLAVQIAKPIVWQPYAAPAQMAYSAPQACCQDTVKMFSLLAYQAPRSR